HLVEAHGLQAVARRLARPGQERLADRAVEAQGARLGLFARGALRLGDVDRHDRADLTAAGVARRAPRGVIRAHVALELADARRPNRQEDREPATAYGRIRLLRRRGDTQRRVRLLERLGHCAHVVELEVLALVSEPVLGPRLQENLECLVETLLALVERNVEARIVTREPAPAHAEVE